MSKEVWFRNARLYIREIAEVRHPLVLWDRGTLVKNSLDAVKYCELHFPQDVYFRTLIVGNSEQGCMELTRGGRESLPDAVYPVWEYGEPWEELESLVENPVGEDIEACEDKSTPKEHRPVFGQEHRVVISRIPNLGTGPGRKFMRLLHELQLEHPECIIHIHGVYAFKQMFGLSFRAVDFDARTPASMGHLILPNGKSVSPEKAASMPKWITLLGYNPVDLKVPRNRCMYTMKSALWAAKHFQENVPFKSKGEHTPDVISADAVAALPVAKSGHGIRSAAKEGDKFTCDTCSLANECKYFREGSVCSVSGSEPESLGKFFNTRDSDTIIQGLGILLKAQAERLERGMEDEEYGDELDPEVSKMINSLFANGAKLAKLTNPDLNGGTKVGVFVNGGQGSSVAVGGSASQLTAAIVNELEAKGIPRSDITPEMISRVLDPNAVTQPAIEARAVVKEDE